MDRLATIVTALCGAASLTFMFMVGRQQRSGLLILLFTVWVGSPFVALLYGQSKRASLGWLDLVVSVVSTAIYAVVALGPPLAQPAKFFLLVPLVSWAVIGISRLILRKRG